MARSAVPDARRPDGDDAVLRTDAGRSSAPADQLAHHCSSAANRRARADTDDLSPRSRTIIARGRDSGGQLWGFGLRASGLGLRGAGLRATGFGLRATGFWVRGSGRLRHIWRWAKLKCSTQLKRACSAVGSAPEWHSGGHRFDPGQVHQPPLMIQAEVVHHSLAKILSQATVDLPSSRFGATVGRRRQRSAERRGSS